MSQHSEIAIIASPHDSTTRLLAAALEMELVRVLPVLAPTDFQHLPADGPISAAFIDRDWASPFEFRAPGDGSDAYRLCRMFADLNCTVVLIADGPTSESLAIKFGAVAILPRFRKLRRQVRPPADTQYVVDVRRVWRILKGVDPDDAYRELPPSAPTGFAK